VTDLPVPLPPPLDLPPPRLRARMEAAQALELEEELRRESLRIVGHAYALELAAELPPSLKLEVYESGLVRVRSALDGWCRELQIGWTQDPEGLAREVADPQFVGRVRSLDAAAQEAERSRHREVRSALLTRRAGLLQQAESAAVRFRVFVAALLLCLAAALGLLGAAVACWSAWPLLGAVAALAMSVLARNLARAASREERLAEEEAAEATEELCG
jgi:hypothetical protein